MIKTFLSNEDGATAIEYGLIAALISVGIIATVKELGITLADVFQNLTEAMKNN